MAATREEMDYFHLVEANLKENYNPVAAYAFNAFEWEITVHDRGQVLQSWDQYLSDRIDLVTIQLSENVSDVTTFENDFREMVRYVGEKCPNAQIIVIDDFWSNDKSGLKRNAVEGMDVDFVDLKDIRGNSEYQAGMGTVVYDADGAGHVIEHEGVAAHPGDKGMDYYAEKIMEFVKR